MGGDLDGAFDLFREQAREYILDENKEDV